MSPQKEQDARPGAPRTKGGDPDAQGRPTEEPRSGPKFRRVAVLRPFGWTEPKKRSF
jgi:hypothetical protein